MSYNITSSNQYQYFAAVWAEPTPMLNQCVSALSQSFQTQAGRDTVRQQFSNLLSAIVAPNQRFPDTGFRVYVNSAVIKPLYEALMKSFDTKNRIIETEEESRPSASEVANATQRVDDATVAIRSQIQLLLNELSNGHGYMNRAEFEAIVPWTTTPAT
uniref:Capsid protein n=1 Tax=Ribgrass mosaic virus TaxID=51680 RepID=E0WXT0_RMV|nr:coat protein [Ribgrass mosaic virus]ACV13197.1 coat protein [Ribgrass mosaic virus]